MIRVKPIWYTLLEYPILQYIPLNKSPLIIKDNLSGLSKLHIKAINDFEDMKPMIRMYNLDKDIGYLINWEKELPIITINLMAEELKYRTTKVVVLGEEKPGYIELFLVNRSYFYRNSVYFVVFDNQGRRLITSTEIFYID